MANFEQMNKFILSINLLQAYLSESIKKKPFINILK